MTSANTTLLKISRTDDYGFAEIKLLYQRSFSSEERRDPTDLNQLLEQPDFSFYLINHYTWPAGLLAVWQFPDFVFIEHMAISEQFRNRKLGANALEQLITMNDKPLVLESEPPIDDITSSRINFYKRQGFEIIDTDYQQPPYRLENSPQSMVLMSNHSYSPEETTLIVAAIKDKVYPTF